MRTAWRQQRSVTLALSVLVVSGGIFILFKGYREDAVWGKFAAAPCHSQLKTSTAFAGICNARFENAFNFGHYNIAIFDAGILFALIFGSVLGANAVAREFDAKTHHLAWTQSSSRLHWLFQKIFVNISIIFVVVLPLDLLYNWWNSASKFSQRVSPTGFSISGVSLLIYCLVTFFLSVLFGLIFRRVGWSVAASIFLTLLMVLTVYHEILPKLATPHFKVVAVGFNESVVSQVGDFGGGGYPGGSWDQGIGALPKGMLGVGSSKEAGIDLGKIYGCEGAIPGASGNTSFYDCAKSLHLDFVTWFVPDSEFWNLQFSVAALYIAFLIVVLGASVIILTRMLA